MPWCVSDAMAECRPGSTSAGSQIPLRLTPPSVMVCREILVSCSPGRCRFSSFLSPGTSLTWPDASCLIDLSPAFSHRSVISLSGRREGRCHVPDDDYPVDAIAVTEGDRRWCPLFGAAAGRRGSHTRPQACDDAPSRSPSSPNARARRRFLIELSQATFRRQVI